MIQPLRTWALFSLSSSVLVVACGSRTSLSVDSNTTPGNGGAGGDSVTATSSTTSSSTTSSSTTSSSATTSSASTTGPGGGPSCTQEICDGLDNDCDGLIDEGCNLNGCSDGTREGFLDVMAYPKIAACSGGFSVPGLVNATAPTCGLNAGNSSMNPAGVGCSAADLCASGFHVCKGAVDVEARSLNGCDDAAPGPDLFFATRQSSTGCGACALGTGVDPAICNGCSCAGNCAQTPIIANDLFGCGSIGSEATSCGVLDRTSQDGCSELGSPWNCSAPTSSGCDEAKVVTKGSSAGGGVLCCSD